MPGREIGAATRSSYTEGSRAGWVWYGPARRPRCSMQPNPCHSSSSFFRSAGINCRKTHQAARCDRD